MARNTTRQGAAFELTVIHHLDGCQLREEPCKNPRHASYTGFGYDSLRSSGSRGKVDVVAVGPKPVEELWENPHTLYVPGGPLLFIQCKITNPVIPPAERHGIQGLALRAGAIPLVAHWAKDQDPASLTYGFMRVHYRQLTGPGPRDWAHWAPGEDN